MTTREDLERRERDVLAPWAARSAGARRDHGEAEHPYRTAFQRDRDRVVHSTAFRRLEYKTQVFVYHEGDHYRTRLTHTLEAAQISRTVARALGLNEDLAETITLAHDMGHPPFGHAAEHVLAELMRDHGGFDHNRQSLRIVETLERSYPGFPGLNLTWEVRESIVKHGSGAEGGVPERFRPAEAPLLEAQMADVADEIAYDSHDLEDALASGIIALEELEGLALWREALAAVRARFGTPPEKILRRQVVLAGIDRMVGDLITASSSAIQAAGVRSLADVRGHPGGLIRFSDALAPLKKEVEGYLRVHFYNHYRVCRMTNKARKVVRDLFGEFVARPESLPVEWQRWAREEGLHRAVADYIAGMTDRYALDEHARLYSPEERV